MNRVEAALAVCRFLQDGAALLLWGAFAYLAALVPSGLANAVDRPLAPVRNASIVVALAATAALLPLHAADASGRWADAFDPATLHALLFETRIGGAWQWQAAAALLLVLANLLPATQRRPAIAVAAGVLLACVALTGHAVSEAGGRGIAHHVVDTLHLLCGGAWLGALPPLLFALTALKDPAHRADAVTALRRFSTAGHAAVAGVIATGALNTWFVLRHASLDLASPYRRLLLCKLVLVAGMTALAITNRYRWVPRLKQQPADALRAIRRATLAEIALGLGAVALVAVFGLLEPA